VDKIKRNRTPQFTSIKPTKALNEVNTLLQSFETRDPHPPVLLSHDAPTFLQEPFPFENLDDKKVEEKMKRFSEQGKSKFFLSIFLFFRF